MDTTLTPKEDPKPRTEIREKILAIVDEKHGAFWGDFFDALIQQYEINAVRLALSSLVKDRTLRMKEDSTEHDWEYRRAELGGLPVRGVPTDYFICVGCGETVSEWSHLINEDCIVSDKDLRSEKIGEWECNHCGSQEWIDPANEKLRNPHPNKS